MSRVAFLVSHPIGAWMNGADVATLAWAGQLRDRGHQVTIIVAALTRQPAFVRWRARLAAGTPPTIAGIAVEIHDVPLAGELRPSTIDDEVRRSVDAAVATAVASARPDVVIVPWGTPQLATAARAHHDRVVLIAQNAGAFDDLRERELAGIELVTVSAQAAARLARHVGSPPRVLLNAIATPPTSVSAPDGPVGMVNLCGDKGALVFLNVAANLPRRSFIATGGWAGRAHDYTAMATGLANVEILPAAPSLDRFYARLGVLLVPSLVGEAFGRVVIEAQLAGVPVVCSSRCPARTWCGGVVVEVPPRPEEGSDADLHDAERHRSTIRAFLDAVTTLADPDNHAVVVAAGRDAAARYLADQRASIDAFARWIATG